MTTMIPANTPAGYTSASFDGSTRGAFNTNTGALLVCQGGYASFQTAVIQIAGGVTQMPNLPCSAVLIKGVTNLAISSSNTTTGAFDLENGAYIELFVSNLNQIYLVVDGTSGITSVQYIVFI